ncbi:MAG: FAD-dependent monooxygenase [Gammaproteobacteria bacterium]|nr:FAD-dependent monooxygenase [Gammaproteobacteria bacterium]
MRRHPVAVVGGGIVGAALALDLARRGLDPVLIERGKRPPAFDPAQDDLRVYAIAPASVRALRCVGAWDAIAARRASPYRDMRVWEEDQRHELHFSAAEAGVPELGYILESSLILDALWQRLDGLPVRTETAVAGVQFDADGVRLRLADGEVLEAEVAVAAEGADSGLRDSAGIEVMGWGYAQRAIVCHVRTEKPHECTAFQRFLPGGPLAFLPLADGRSSIVWSAELGEADGLLKLADTEFCARLGAASQYRLGAVLATTARASFPLRLQHAARYVRSGLALVGDSAHVVHPLAGQGVNLGLADIGVLAEVLQAARDRGQPLGG